MESMDQDGGDGQAQRWDPNAYARNARFVSDLGYPVLELLAPKHGERILDLGCGDGALTETLAAMGVRVIGVDGSAEQIAAARDRGLDAQVMDGHALTFDDEFDAVFSNAALHWMRRPDDVIAGVWNALHPGGRFVGEMGGAGNVATIQSALKAAISARGTDADAVDPWYFPSPEEYGRRLEGAGFLVRSIDLFPRPTPLPGDFRGWLETFAGSFLETVDDVERPAIMDEVTEAVRSRLQKPDGRWVADYVRLRFAAEKPA